MRAENVARITPVMRVHSMTFIPVAGDVQQGRVLEAILAPTILGR